MNFQVVSRPLWRFSAGTCLLPRRRLRHSCHDDGAHCAGPRCCGGTGPAASEEAPATRQLPGPRCLRMSQSEHWYLEASKTRRPLLMCISRVPRAWLRALLVLNSACCFYCPHPCPGVPLPLQVKLVEQLLAAHADPTVGDEHSVTESARAQSYYLST